MFNHGTDPKAAGKKPDEWIVTEPAELLEFLLQKQAKLSRNKIKSLLLYRQVFVDGKAVAQYNHPLRAGQKITVSHAGKPPVEAPPMLDILYEDDEILVINKPAGMLSISTDKEKERTAYHLLTDYVRAAHPKNRIFAVHRLDKDTSGVLMAAKNEEMKHALQDNWAELVSVRGYAALVEGKLSEKSGRVRSWLRETKTHLMYSSYKTGDGLEAITDYQVLKEGAEYSLLDIRLETGRKNQIRVHMKDLGHPVAGDKKYGAQTNPLKRLALHAYILEIRHPFTQEILRFETPIPKSFSAILKKAPANPAP